MPFAPETFQRIIQAIKTKVPVGQDAPRCSVCATEKWNVSDGFVTFYSHYPGAAYMPAAPNLPSLALICQHCGNTLFLNVFSLGLGDLVGQMGG